MQADEPCRHPLGVIETRPPHQRSVGEDPQIALGMLERFHQGGREKRYSGLRPCVPGFILVAFCAENRNPVVSEIAPACCWSMIFSENRHPLFGIML